MRKENTPSEARSLLHTPADSLGEVRPTHFPRGILIDEAEIDLLPNFDLSLDVALSDPATIRAALPVQLETTGVTSHAHTVRGRAGKAAGGSGGAAGKAPANEELWATKTVHKMSVAAKLREGGMHDEATSLEDCHTIPTFAQCDGCQKVSIWTNRCDRIYCPECAPKLSRLRLESIEWWTREINQPKHVVLTVRNANSLSKSYLQVLKKSLSRLRRRRFARNWKGGFYCMEITNEGRGWHVHFHLLIDAKWIDGRQLATEWASCVGQDIAIVKVKDARAKDYLAEVTKYVVKGSQMATWPTNEVCAFVRAIEGVRTFGVFGILYGKRTEFRAWLDAIKGKNPICSCGCESRRYYSLNEWIARDCKPSPSTMPRPPSTPQSEFSLATPIKLTSNYAGGL